MVNTMWSPAQQRSCDARGAAKNGDQAKLAMAENDLAQLAEKLDGLSVHEKRYIVNDGTVEKLGEILNQTPRGLLLVGESPSLNANLRGIWEISG